MLGGLAKNSMLETNMPEMGAGQAPQREGLVLIEVKKMQELLSRCENGLDTLGSRIAPFLRPSMPQPGTNEKEQNDHGVVFAHILEDANKRLEYLDNRIRDMKDRVEM